MNKIKRVSLITRPQELGKHRRRLEVVFIRDRGRHRVIRPRSFDRLIRLLRHIKPSFGLTESGWRHPGAMWLSWRIRD